MIHKRAMGRRRNQANRKRSCGNSSLSTTEKEQKDIQDAVPPDNRGIPDTPQGDNSLSTSEKELASDSANGVVERTMGQKGNQANREQPQGDSSLSRSEKELASDSANGVVTTISAACDNERAMGQQGNQANRNQSQGDSSLPTSEKELASDSANGVVGTFSAACDNKRTMGRQGNRTNKKRSQGGTSLPTSEKELASDSAHGQASGLKRRKLPKKDVQDGIPPEQRAIPDTPLLRNLGKHPSVYARLGRGSLTQNLNLRGAWPTALALYHEAHDQYKELLELAGFEDFLKIGHVHIPQSYLVALTERWFSETNTLHLPCCEIGPTPVDWTLVTGLRFTGQPIVLNHQYEKSKALELLGVGPEAITEGKIRLSSITPTMKEVKMAPENDEAKAVLFRRLFLYVVASCFFNNNRSVINYELVQYLEKIDEVGSYNWGAITFAAFLAGMRRKVTGETGAFTGFWPFLVLWAFEYLDIFRPIVADKDVFPRSIRWSSPRSLASADFSDLLAARCQLDYIKEAQVTWQPYVANTAYSSADMVNTILLAKKRVPFQSIDTWEYYLGERCQRQLDLPCRVPLQPPSLMHGTNDLSPEDEIGVGRLTGNLVMDEEVDYSSWFATHSVGKIVDLSQFLGGVEIGSRVLEHWMAIHHPENMIIRRSEYEVMIEARDAAVAECEVLREKLAHAKGYSSSRFFSTA